MGIKEIRTAVRRSLLLILFFGACVCTRAQVVGVKSNLLADAAATPTLMVEVGLRPHWSAQLGASLNAWTLKENRRWRHLSIMPEARYWFCDRFLGHFLGLHAFGGQYNVGGIDVPLKFLGTDFRKLKDARFQGWYAGAGVAYGYAYGLSRHWNIEGEIGLGYAYTRYDRFRCAGCGKKVEEDKPHHYVGPTKLAVSLVYYF